MLRLSSLFGFAVLLVGGCTRAPSTPAAAGPSSETQAERGAKFEPIPGECDADELQSCADACRDRECLDWCAGSSCVATIANLWSCMDEAEQRFAADHPTPTLEFETAVGGDEENEYPTEESLARAYEWDEAHKRALDQRWEGTCSSSCTASFTTADDTADDEIEFCEDWWQTYPAWKHLSGSKVEDRLLIISKIGSKSGQLGAVSLGTPMSLTGELADGPSDHRTRALEQLVERAGWNLDGANSCVPDLDDQAVEFTFAVEFDAEGQVQAAQAVDGPAGSSACVAARVTAALELPVRVAREFPQIEVRVLVQTVLDLSGSALGDALDGLEGVE